MVELNAEQTKKVESLVAMGLPEAQAKISAATDAGPVVETRKVSTLVTLKFKEGANLEELKPLFAEYTKNSAASGGKISCMNSMSDEECIMLETWNSREALHAHIGNCFPAYSKMMAYCEMNEMFCICDSAEDVEFYKKELAVWGPKRFVVVPKIC